MNPWPSQATFILDDPVLIDLYGFFVDEDSALRASSHDHDLALAADALVQLVSRRRAVSARELGGLHGIDLQQGRAGSAELRRVEGDVSCSPHELRVALGRTPGRHQLLRRLRP